ncbi:MAG: T9SS type A sorting domain-containing protein [Saprospiraceae bacterium]
MNKYAILLLLLILITPPVLAQPSIQWQRTLGGTLYESSSSIVQTTDKGYITAGFAESVDGDVVGSHGNVDFWVVKMDSAGAVQWKKAYGGSGLDWPYSIIQTTDGEYVAVGYTESNDGDVLGNHGDKDIWVLKLNNVGVIQWQKCLGGSGWDEASSVKQTDDGGYILAGRTSSTDGDVAGFHGYLDYWVVKLDSTGVLEWQKCLGGTGLDIGYAIVQTNDGGYIVTGESDSNDGDVKYNHGNSDYWVVKLNFEGKIEWEKSLGGIGIDWGNDIRQTREGGYIVIGQARSTGGDVTGNHGGYDCWVVKLTEIGEIEWEKALGGSNGDVGLSIQQTLDDGYILVGVTQSIDGDVIGNHGNLDAWVVKLTVEGEIQWQRALGGTGPEIGFSIQQTDDKGYIMSGDAWSNDGDVSGVQGKTDFWIVKLSPESSPTTTAPSVPLEIFPNPGSGIITLSLPDESSSLTLSIADMLGRELSRQTIAPGDPVDTSTLVNGFYLLTATTPSGKVFSGKFRKQE